MAISKYDDIIDSRDVIARIEELQDEIADLQTPEDTIGRILAARLGTDPSEYDEPAQDERDELAMLEAVAKEASDYAADWEYGEALIRYSHIKEYAQEMAEDCGMLENTDTWPARCIDWDQATREFVMDYTEVDFDGVTYYIR